MSTLDTYPLGLQGEPTGSDESFPSPDALASMSPVELAALAARIRRFVVDAVSVTGGHLGSNLGAVELTIALHRVFRSPADALVWDTGHQAYVHKLLTGRAERFGGLRQAGGLSGYPNRAESAHDLVENSHASTALSYAFGLARARAALGDPHRVVAVVGDGALTGGLAYEGLNNIGAAGLPVVVVLNDNGRSYAPTVSRLSTAHQPPGTGAAPDRFFTALGFEYLGPVDGHDVGAVEDGLRAAAAVGRPAVLHVHTTKGLGYAPAEEDVQKCLHDIGPFDPATGVRRTSPDDPPSYTDAFGRALLAEAARRPDMVVLTAAMAGPTGLLPFAARYPDRLVDVGIAEAHAVTAAAGMAMGGLRPVVAVYSTFLNRAWDQVYYDVGLHRLPVVFCLDRAGVTGDDGASHHGLLDLMLLSKVPGMTVLAPSCYEDVADMLHHALETAGGPVAIRWPKTGAVRRRPERVGPAGLPRPAPSPPGMVRARRVRSDHGAEVCLLGVGKLLAACEEAADLLALDGVAATVWDVRSVVPLDPAMLADAARHRAVVTVEDGVVEGGAGAAIGAALRRSGSAVPVVACGLPVAYVPQGNPAAILSGFGLDGPGVHASARAALRPGASPCGGDRRA